MFFHFLLIIRVCELVRGLLSPLIVSLPPSLLSGVAHDISLRTYNYKLVFNLAEH